MDVEAPQRSSFAKTLRAKGEAKPQEVVFSDVNGRVDLSQVLTVEERRTLNQLFSGYGHTASNESVGLSNALDAEIGSRIDLEG